MRKRRVFLIIVLVVLVGAIVFSFRDTLLPVISNAIIERRYSSIIEKCDSLKSETIFFEKVCEYKENKQVIFRIADNATFDDIESAMRIVKTECERIGDKDDVWQIVFCMSARGQIDIYEPIVILTNQSVLTGEPREKLDCLHLCRYSTDMQTILNDFEGISVDYVKELTLYGRITSIDFLSEWTQLDYCVYSSKHVTTGKMYDVKLSLSHEEFNDLVKKSIKIQVFSDLSGDVLFVPNIHDR